MQEELFQLRTIIPFQSSVISTVVVILISVILGIIYNIIRKTNAYKDSFYHKESKYIFFMISFFTIFASTRIYTYAVPWARVAGINMAIHIYSAFFAMFYFLKLLFVYGRDEDKPYARIIPIVELVYTLIFIAVTAFTKLLIRGYQWDDLTGWTLLYGPMFNFGFGIPFFIIITYGMIRLIKARVFFKENRLESSRYTLLVLGMSLMIFGSIFEVTTAILDLTLNIGDTAVIGATFMSLFIGLASIIQFYQIQVRNQKSETDLLEIFTHLKKNMDSGKDTLQSLSPAVVKLNKLSVDLNDFVELSKNRAHIAFQKSNLQKKHVKNFSSMVISNITIFDEILASMDEQKVKIQEFRDIIGSINTLLTNISDNGKIVSGGVVNLNSVINDAKVHSDRNYQLITQVKNSINKIVQVTQAIDRVAEDSNVLSMNASIESATSGDTGTGFKVVAQDLRNMSIMTNTETSKIKDIVRLLQSDLEKGFSSAESVKMFFTDLEKTVEKVFNFVMTIIQNSNQLIEKIEKVNQTIESLLEIANESLVKGEQQQKLNNELNESIVSMKFMIESIRRAMSETLDIMASVFDFSHYVQDSSVSYQIKSNELMKVINHIEDSINIAKS